MAPTPAPEGSPAAHFAALLRHHMDVGTRPTGASGTGKWTEDGLCFKAGGISRRTLQYYRNGSLQPPDVTYLVNAFFGEDPRHAFKRKVFLNAYANATGTEPPSSALAEANISVHVPAHFVGRNDALSAIDAALAVDQRRVVITALHGLRGVGKTTVAAAYAYRRQRQYHATWWVRAHTEPTMRSDLINLGVRLRWIAAEDKEEPALAAILERLRQEGEGVLLIFDNALSAESLIPYLPRDGAAQVLITSNAHNWRLLTRADPIEVRVWPPHVGADFLIARTGRSTEREAAEALSKALGGLPLAHEQAAAYCERLEVDFAEYRRRFAAAPVKMLDNKRYAPAHYYNGQTVAKTFGLSIEAASKEHPAVQTLIWHLALLAPESVPLFLLKEKRGSLGEPLASLLDEEELDEVVAALRAFALVDSETIVDERDVGIVTRAIRLHRLVREVAAALPTIREREIAKKALISAIVGLYPEEVFHDPKTWPRARRLDALALALVDDKSELLDSADKPVEIPEGAEQLAALLMCRLGAYRQGALGAYAKARALHDRALSLREKELGPEHPDTAESLNYLAILLREQEDRITARPLFERALKIRKKVLGLEHRDTAESLNNFALLLWDEGNLQKAKLLFESSLKIRERVLGFEHEDTGSSYNNLALVLRDQGNIVEARPLFERALEIKLNTLGFEHPYTAVSFNNLALALRDLHNYEGAQPLFESALTIWEKVSGPEHPYTGRTRTNFARMLFMAGNAEAAQSEGYAAIAVHEKTQGPTHHWTLDAAQVTIDALNALGRLDEAAGVQERYLPSS